MTVQRKRLVGLMDICAVELRCKDCGTTVGLPPDKIPGAERLAKCPNCGEDWLSYKTAEKLAEAFGALTALRWDLEAAREAKHGVVLHVEVPDDPLEPHR